MFTRLKTSYPLPKLLENAIDELENGVKNNVSYIDCLQDEIRANSRILLFAEVE